MRRSFLKLGTAAHPAFPDHPTTRPLPENVLSPDAALERLIISNECYVSGQSNLLHFVSDRSTLLLLKGQKPYACILSCTDSRASPEFTFEQRGDLSVSSVAGHYLTLDFIATLEYEALVLYTPIMLGHEGCDAAKAAMDAVDKDERFPWHIPNYRQCTGTSSKRVTQMPG